MFTKHTKCKLTCSSRSTTYSNSNQLNFMREFSLTRDSPSSALASLAVAMSIACFRCSARCSGVINLVVSRNCPNGLCATKTNEIEFYRRKNPTINLEFFQVICNRMNNTDRSTSIAHCLSHEINSLRIIRW